MWLWSISGALACGGLFCNSAQPVDQVGERILFALVDDKIEVHVQISYEGPAEEFSWIVPVPAEPELMVSTDDIFQRLGMSTAPLYQPVIEDLGECNSGVVTGQSAPNVDMAASDGGGGQAPFEAPEATVTVVQELQVGPYDAQILTANDAGVLVQWLEEHDYDLPPGGEDKIAPYVSAGSYYIGLQLQKDRDAGDLVPVAFRYPGADPMIPLQLTAVAAGDDMRLQPFVLGPSRAVPENYLHVVVNDLAVDWLTAGANYLDVVRRAADAAGGQGFVTDAAVKVEDLEMTLWRDGLYPTQRIRGMDDAWELNEVLVSLGYVSPVDNSWQDWEMIPVSSGTVPILARFVSPPDGMDPFRFFQCISCYVERGELAFDGAALADALEQEWVAVMRHAQELVDRSGWVTRLSSSMSADEMTLDPRFVLNPDLPAVPAAREGILQFDCRQIHDRGRAPRKLILADGRSIDLPPLQRVNAIDFTWDTWIGALYDLPAALIEQTGRSGDAVVVTDNRAAIDAELEAINGPQGCGCQTGGGSLAWSALLLAGLWGRRSPRAT